METTFEFRRIGATFQAELTALLRRGDSAVLLGPRGLGKRFVTLQTGDLGPGKPHPAMLERALAETGAAAADCVMIGDTTFDMEMARNAGVAGIAVAWGYHPVSELQAAGATALVERYDQLPDLLARR